MPMRSDRAGGPAEYWQKQSGGDSGLGGIFPVRPRQIPGSVATGILRQAVAPACRFPGGRRSPGAGSAKFPVNSRHTGISGIGSGRRQPTLNLRPLSCDA